MSVTTTVTGNLGHDSELRFTPSGAACLELSIGATPRQRVKDTDQWEDVGAPLWIKATFWRNEAERLHESGRLRKGTRVTVTGTLMLRNYTTRDGRPGQSIELHNPRFLGLDDIPRTPQGGQQQAQGQWNQPAGGTPTDPWATHNAPF